MKTIKKKTKLIIICSIVCISFSTASAQDCYKTVTNDPLNYKNVKYTGCVDRFDRPDGKGAMYILQKKKKKKWQEGFFKNGELNGFGRKYFKDEKNYIEGNFTNGNQLNGVFLTTSDDGIIFYEEYENGEVIKKWNNTNSKYNERDIISSSAPLALELIKHPSYVNAYFIDIAIGSNKELFLFDTGAFGNFLTKEMLRKLKEITNVELLPIKNQTVTVGGGEKVSMKFYFVKSLKFENLEVKNIVFGVLDKETENSQCILGMDFFENKFSKFDLDFNNKKIYLEK
jgi:hypothetical protein